MNNLNGIFNTPDHTEEFDYNDVQNTNVVVTALTYIFFFIPYIFAPNSQYAKFHANQALIYLICEIVLRVASSIICTVTDFIPLVGSIVGFIVPLLVWIVSIGLFIFGIVNACNKQAKELPIVGGFTILK
ncbi:MAG: hypothetical protein LIO71_03955 [Ruminococcus sp.]|nr:hypothetical protein [Ruminococcus sp.]